tara:strand:+ start:2086 stop:2625 length:540 start_codon:yes stop_codon:yes gene_type:complete
MGLLIDSARGMIVIAYDKETQDSLNTLTGMLKGIDDSMIKLLKKAVEAGMSRDDARLQFIGSPERNLILGCMAKITETAISFTIPLPKGMQFICEPPAPNRKTLTEIALEGQASMIAAVEVVIAKHEEDIKRIKHRERTSDIERRIYALGRNGGSQQSISDEFFWGCQSMAMARAGGLL